MHASSKHVSPGLDPMEAVHVQDGDAECGGPLVLMMVWHVDAHQEAGAPHLRDMSHIIVLHVSCYHNQWLIVTLSFSS